MSATLLNELNAFRANDGKDPFKDWRKARHMPMLEAYRQVRDGFENGLEDAFEASADELAAQVVRQPVAEEVAPAIAPVTVEVLVEQNKTANEKIAKVATTEVAAEKAPKGPSYKEAANYAKSTIEKPVEFIHAWLDANPNLGRKASVIALQEKGINYSTARTQYQKWFTARKG